MNTNSLGEAVMEWNSRLREKNMERQWVKTKGMMKSVNTSFDLIIVRADYEGARY